MIAVASLLLDYSVGVLTAVTVFALFFALFIE